MREEAYRNLSAELRGSVITSDSDEYEVARRVYNGMIDRRPDAIVRCAGGGHNGAGFGVCDRGLVIDLYSMKGVLVNPATNTIRAEAGSTQADLSHAAHDFGLAVPLGVISSTGSGTSSTIARILPNAISRGRYFLAKSLVCWMLSVPIVSVSPLLLLVFCIPIDQKGSLLCYPQI
jgi:hypothetical protein